MPTDEPKAPYLDPSLPIPERVADLVGRMTLQEKVSQLCAGSGAVPRLGLPAYEWGGECLHGLCHTGRATMFPQAIGLAATFDTELVQQVADAISTEARAKHHDPVWHGPDGPRVGLTYWTPVINIFRDPRWGRGQETYGEDPFLSGAMGAAFVRGLQGDDPRWLKVSALRQALRRPQRPGGHTHRVRRAREPQGPARDLPARLQAAGRRRRGLRHGRLQPRQRRGLLRQPARCWWTSCAASGASTGSSAPTPAPSPPCTGTTR